MQTLPFVTPRFDRVACFAANERGSVVAMAALIVLVLLLAMLGATTLMMALGKRQQLQAIAQVVCSRAVKPLRMTTLTDATRKTRAEALFDELAKDRGLAIASRSVTTDWLESRVVAKATVPVMSDFGRQAAVTIAADEFCAGIPPYPAVGDIVLSSNFKTPDGTSISLPNSDGANGKWGVFSGQQLGWDGRSGSGAEIQDRTNGFLLTTTKAYLPAGVSNPYVVELDSGLRSGSGYTPTTAPACGRKAPGYNSSIHKDFELHAGTYRISLYRARAVG